MPRFKAEPAGAWQKRLEPTTGRGFIHHWDASHFSVETRCVPGSLLKPKEQQQFSLQQNPGKIYDNNLLRFF